MTISILVDPLGFIYKKALTQRSERISTICDYQILLKKGKKRKRKKEKKRQRRTDNYFNTGKNQLLSSCGKTDKFRTFRN